ncbi:hypothetical protein M2419_001298 [Sphingobacterium sp. BIGb0116]|nr:hypothetical protein [Sphingobacterium sp. BIGb0116]
MPFFTRKPLLETVKGFFRLNTSMTITLPPLTITAYPPHIGYRSIGPSAVVAQLSLSCNYAVTVPQVLHCIHHPAHFISEMEVNVPFSMKGLQ